MHNYADKAKEVPGQVFVVYNNGDTLKGSKLNQKNGWKMDGKKIKSNDVRVYQNNEGYIENGRLRIIKGKLSLFAYMRDDSHYQSVYNSSTNTFSRQSVGATTTSFYYKFEGAKQEPLSYNTLKKAIQDCPQAIKKFETVFANSPTKKHPSWLTNDYPKIIPVIEAYNANCK